MFQPNLSQSRDGGVGHASFQEIERPGWNISAMTMKVIPQVTTKGENVMLRNSNCAVTEAVMFQPNLSSSCQVTRNPTIRGQRQRTTPSCHETDRLVCDITRVKTCMLLKFGCKVALKFNTLKFSTAMFKTKEIVANRLIRFFYHAFVYIAHCLIHI